MQDWLKTNGHVASGNVQAELFPDQREPLELLKCANPANLSKTFKA